MLAANITIERLVINNTDMTERGFTAVVSVLREGNNPIRELSIGFQLLRSREVGKGGPPPVVSEQALVFKQASCHSLFSAVLLPLRSKLLPEQSHASSKLGRCTSHNTLSRANNNDISHILGRLYLGPDTFPMDEKNLCCSLDCLFLPRHDVTAKQEIVTYQISRLLETPVCMLRSLNLSSSAIGDEGAKVLRGVLTGHPTMRSLDLSRNRVGIVGGQALAKLLVNKSSLTSLDLRANLIGDEGAQAFKVVLLNNPSLRR